MSITILTNTIGGIYIAKINEIRNKLAALRASALEKSVVEFPSDTEGLTVIGNLGGSTGAKLVEDANGNKFVMKTGGDAGNDADGHVRNEANADNFYRSVGINVPECKIYETENGPVKLSRFIEDGQSLNEWWDNASDDEKEKMREKLRQGLSADILLGNWDVIGLGADNIIVDKNGIPWRIDNGGALGYRAQGKKKSDEDWAEGYPDELWTMTGRGANIKSTVTSNVPNYMGQIDLLDAINNINGQDWEAAMSKLPDEDKEVLMKRLENIRLLARRGNGYYQNGSTLDYSEQILDHSYNITKAGLQNDLAEHIDIDEDTPGNTDLYGTGLREGGPGKPFYEWMEEYVNSSPLSTTSEPEYTIIERWARAQADDSYDPVACEFKMYQLHSMGYDVTDHTKSVDEIVLDLKDMGFYIGDEIGSPIQKEQEKSIRNAIDEMRSNPDLFKRGCDAHARYQAGVTLALEKMAFAMNDQDNWSVILSRTESGGIEGVKGKDIGDVCTHSCGIAESFSHVTTVCVGGHELTMTRVPYSRINGFWMTRRASREYMFYNDGENEFNVCAKDLTTFLVAHGVDKWENIKKKGYLDKFKEAERNYYSAKKK